MQQTCGGEPVTGLSRAAVSCQRSVRRVASFLESLFMNAGAR